MAGSRKYGFIRNVLELKHCVKVTIPRGRVTRTTLAHFIRDHTVEGVI